MPTEPMSIELSTVDAHVALMIDALTDHQHPYHCLADVLASALFQSAVGKGQDRHANDLPFDKQRMQSIADGQGHIGGMIYQVCKKAEEAEGMRSRPQQVHELLGAIVYAAGAIVWLDRHPLPDSDAVGVRGTDSAG